MGGVAGSAHGSATTGSGSGGDSTEITGAGGVGDSANAGGGTVDTGGGKGEMASDSGSVGAGLDSGWDAGPGPMLTGKKFVGNISTVGALLRTSTNTGISSLRRTKASGGRPNPSRHLQLGAARRRISSMHSRTTSFSNTTTSFGAVSNRDGSRACPLPTRCPPCRRGCKASVVVFQRQAHRRRQRAASSHDAAVPESDWWHRR